MSIRKINVARGILWVEVPEADLRVLCGCPADSVKHLIKRGLIVPQEIKGVKCETGPNAILLSDISPQCDEFANLAEFPVLQMLYLQGMMVPGHPNNTGRKPVLIGSAEQVECQMRYVYRGNYGLVSREEIIQAGVPAERAAELMRLKLKFAFGRIRPTRDFLDTYVIGDAPVEIAKGVSVRRLQPNHFEFTHGGESVAVDLNLPPGETYECAYPLDYHGFEPEYFSVIHSGEGDGWDVKRPCMASIITFQGCLYLIDAGPHLAHSMAALGIGIHQVDGVFHTHAHDDHFAGISELMRADRRIRYFATPLVRASVQKKLAALLGMAEDRFTDFFDVQDLTVDEWNNIDGLEVMPQYSPHPVETNTFVFRALCGDGYRTYAHLADIASMDVLQGMVTGDQEAPGLSSAACERARAAYLAPADLKKIDIGGGMIHGSAKDFRADTSARILLAHRASDLTPSEKEIGSSAAFGTVDVLVPGQSEGLRRHAFACFSERMPEIPLHELRMLVNHPIMPINPGAIVLREGEAPRELLLLLSGQVERMRARDNLHATLSAGSLIDTSVVLDNRPSQYTYRTASFVRAMRIPLGIYTEVVRRHGLLDRMRRGADLREFLDATNLFNKGLPVAVIGNITDTASERHFGAGEIITGKDLQVLSVLRGGRVERTVGGKVLDVLKARDFFGEEGAVLNVPYLFHLRVLEPTSVIQIPGELLSGVPIVRWKLYQSYQQRVVRVIYGSDPAEFLTWRDGFSLQIAQMDNHHKRLIEIGDAILEQVYGEVDRDSLARAFDSLVSYAHYHFEAEEKLMALYGYPDAVAHGNVHRNLERQVAEYRQQVSGGNMPDRAGFRHFFESWLVRHMVDEDRKYGAYLNAKGVY